MGIILMLFSSVHFCLAFRLAFAPPLKLQRHAGGGLRKQKEPKSSRLCLDLLNCSATFRYLTFPLVHFCLETKTNQKIQESFMLPRSLSQCKKFYESSSAFAENDKRLSRIS